MKLDSAQVRKVSWRTISGRGLRENLTLPLLEEPSIMRSMAAHVEKTLSLHVVVARAFGLPKELASKWVETEHISDGLTESDRQFLAGDDSLKIQKQADVHCLYVLAWALSVVPSLSIDGEMPRDLVKLMPELWSMEKSSDFRLRAKQRHSSEILQALDLAYCLHWALEDARLSCAHHPALAGLPIVVRRRLALEWLVSATEWDAIELDT
jgi:hypothetical protein